VFRLVVFFVTVVVSAFDEVETCTGSDDVEDGVVVTETLNEVVNPRLESLHPVDEENRFEDRSLDLETWFAPRGRVGRSGRASLRSRCRPQPA
jgi:hypothetical protein